MQNHTTQQHITELSLYSSAGERKYVNADEQVRFLDAASHHDPRTETLCMLLTYTGCRISEALALSASSVQTSSKVISIRSLKKRNKVVIREVPVPTILIEQFVDVFELTSPDDHRSHPSQPFWTWKRTWSWVQVKRVMAEAGIAGLHATPKGLRHGFGVRAVQSGIPLNLVQKWLGHAQLSTTAIYANAVGPEEHAIAMRMW